MSEKSESGEKKKSKSLLQDKDLLELYVIKKIKSKNLTVHVLVEKHLLM